MACYYTAQSLPNVFAGEGKSRPFKLEAAVLISRDHPFLHTQETNKHSLISDSDEGWCCRKVVYLR